MRTIDVAREFSPYPAGRTRRDGTFTGEAFREDILIPALEENDSVVLNIDGVAGLPSSFWEEIFGGLVRSRRYTSQQLRVKIKVQTQDRALVPYVRLAQLFADEAAR